MDDPLAGLDEIDWSQLSHAYGPATDVPDLLRALAASEESHENDDDPIYELYGNIYHQGTVYEATAHAVPFLVRLASDSKINRRDDIIGLLHSIATSSEYSDWSGGQRNRRS